MILGVFGFWCDLISAILKVNSVFFAGSCDVILVGRMLARSGTLSDSFWLLIIG